MNTDWIIVLGISGLGRTSFVFIVGFYKNLQTYKPLVNYNYEQQF